MPTWLSGIPSLHPARVIQECDWHRIVKHSLGEDRIRWRLETGEFTQRRQALTQSQVAGDSHYCCLEIGVPAVDPVEKGGELELANGDLDTCPGELGLDHLLQRCLAAADGQQLERQLATTQCGTSAIQ